MLIHIGYDDFIESDELVAMISAKGMTAETAAFIDKSRARGRFTPCSEKERSYLLMQGGHVVASCLRTATLYERFLGM